MKKAEGTIISAISGYYDVEIDNKVVRTRAREFLEIVNKSRW